MISVTGRSGYAYAGTAAEHIQNASRKRQFQGPNFSATRVRGSCRVDPATRRHAPRSAFASIRKGPMVCTWLNASYRALRLLLSIVCSQCNPFSYKHMRAPPIAAGRCRAEHRFTTLRPNEAFMKTLTTFFGLMIASAAFAQVAPSTERNVSPQDLNPACRERNVDANSPGCLAEDATRAPAPRVVVPPGTQPTQPAAAEFQPAP